MNKSLLHYPDRHSLFYGVEEEVLGMSTKVRKKQGVLTLHHQCWPDPWHQQQWQHNMTATVLAGSQDVHEVDGCLPITARQDGLGATLSDGPDSPGLSQGIPNPVSPRGIPRRGRGSEVL